MSLQSLIMSLNQEGPLTVLPVAERQAYCMLPPFLPGREDRSGGHSWEEAGLQIIKGKITERNCTKDNILELLI